ncbi:hypothetical protein U959_02663 [Staphylococcus aureus 88088-1]|uniref:DUF334 domain-containing protein n=1 Tax=Staphylococcus aureus TaxID=1280 RepID=UPI00044D43A9|nr:DUF334 domain-containing protein [Staphylococcus aureus]EZW97585.1 hypothetical protein U959_02663 [Staphylococcus aureus 88088-1]
MDERQVEKLIQVISNLNNKVDQLNQNTEKTTVNLSESDKEFLSTYTKELKSIGLEVAQGKNLNIEFNSQLTERLEKKFEQDLEKHLSSIEESTSRASVELEELENRLKKTNKFFYPTLYGVFVAIIGFLMLFFLQGIVGNLFSDQYYPMIAEKVAASTGFNTLLWYLAYIAPVFSIIFALYLVIRLLLKPKLKEFMYK